MHSTKYGVAGNAKGGSITITLTSCLTGLYKSVLKIKTKIVSCHTADSKPVKQEVNSTAIILPWYSLVVVCNGTAEHGAAWQGFTWRGILLRDITLHARTVWCAWHCME